MADSRAYRHDGIDRRQRTGQITFVEHLHVHDRLVGFDRGDHRAAGDEFADAFFPRYQRAFGHGVGKLRHLYHIGFSHGPSYLSITITAETKDNKRKFLCSFPASKNKNFLHPRRLRGNPLLAANNPLTSSLTPATRLDKHPLHPEWRLFPRYNYKVPVRRRRARAWAAHPEQKSNLR